MFSFKPARWLALALAAGSVMAQSAPQTYRSVFEDYRPFTEDKVTPWREANDAVRDIGGWRAYAREAQGTAPPAAQAASAPASAAAHQR